MTRRRIIARLSVGATLATTLCLFAPAAAHAAPTAPGPAGRQDVVAVVTGSDGVTHIDYYDPAPGVSSAQLYALLKARRVPGLVDPASSAGATPSVPGGCNIQGAYALENRCGTDRFHWAGTHPTVYFMDFSGAAWPVTVAVRTWNQSTALNSAWRSWSQPCPGSNCVTVYGAPYGDTGWLGHTSTSSNGRILIGATIQLNDSLVPASNSDEHLAVTCHETGHALGLGHNAYQSSCLYWQYDSSVVNYPGSGDWLMLEDLY